MSRPLRVEYEEAVYHVCARGNERRAIFRDDRDRQCLLDTLAQAVLRFGIVVHGYCLMLNHYHLVLQTPRANLSRAMGWLQTTYTIRFNRRHRRAGHLFQGRFKAQIIEADEYAREVIQYVHLNPVRPRDRREVIPPGRKRTLDAWTFSSHRVYAGQTEAPPWLCTEWLSYFGNTPSAARKAYRRSIAGRFGHPVSNPWADLHGGLVLGSDEFVEKVKSLLGQRSDSRAIQWTQHEGESELHSAVREVLADETDNRVRIWLRVTVAGEPMSAMAREFDYADGSGILRVVQRLESAAKADTVLRKKLAGFRSGVMSRIKR